jgi:hypothetical protein
MVALLNERTKVMNMNTLEAVIDQPIEAVKGQIVVTVEGGIVVSVHSSCPSMQVTIIDLDDMRDEACYHDFDDSEHKAQIANRDALNSVY